MLGQTSRAISRIILHHSAGKDDTYRSIHCWQTTKDDPKTLKVEGKGWSNVAYHFIIERNGSIHRGRSEAVSSGGTLKSSANSLEVCLCGDYDQQLPTEPALQRLRALLVNWCLNYGLQPSPLSIIGHRDVQLIGTPNGTRCPGENLYALLPGLRQHVRDAIGQKGMRGAQANPAPAKSQRI